MLDVLAEDHPQGVGVLEAVLAAAEGVLAELAQGLGVEPGLAHPGVEQGEGGLEVGVDAAEGDRAGVRAAVELDRAAEGEEALLQRLGREVAGARLLEQVEGVAEQAVALEAAVELVAEGEEVVALVDDGASGAMSSVRPWSHSGASAGAFIAAIWAPNLLLRAGSTAIGVIVGLSILATVGLPARR